MCNSKACDKNNYPLKIVVEKSQIINCEFKKEAILKIIPKLDWAALALTVHSVKHKQSNPPAWQC
jgi:multifunctional methyltransferase subunit TRM112